MKLFTKTIQAAKPKEKPYRLSDGDGLHVLIHPNGAKYWQFRYKFAERERSPLSLGKFPEVNLAEARDKRSEARALIREGIDPNVQRRQEKQFAKFNDRNSFLDVATEWHERKKPRWTPDHAITVWQRLENHVFPLLSKRPVAEITSFELLTVIQEIEKKGAAETAHRVLHICDSIFRHAIITLRAESNPAPNLRGYLIPNRAVPLPSVLPEELPKLFKALHTIDTNPTYLIAFKFLAFTAVRTGELRQAKWSDINLSSAIWTIRAETTKRRRTHLVPLSTQSISLLRELRLLGHSGEWLFPNIQKSVHPIMSENAINNMIRRMGYKGKMVGHGFRSLFSSICNEQGFNRDAIERQLAHIEPNLVRAAYNRADYLDARKQIMQWWANHLTDCGLTTHDTERKRTDFADDTFSPHLSVDSVSTTSLPLIIL